MQNKNNPLLILQVTSEKQGTLDHQGIDTCVQFLRVNLQLNKLESYAPSPTLFWQRSPILCVIDSNLDSILGCF